MLSQKLSPENIVKCMNIYIGRRRKNLDMTRYGILDFHIIKYLELKILNFFLQENSELIFQRALKAWIILDINSVII